MKADLLYTIRHINVRDLLQQNDKSAGAGGRVYLVYWWDEIPLGHRWIENPDDKQSDRQKIWESIAPALNFYCALSITVTFDQVSVSWDKGDFALCLQWLNGLFKEYVFHKQDPICDLSLIICIRNRTACLKRCLESLQGLTIQPKEVIIVDNAPSDSSTEDLVRSFPGIKYVRESENGLDRAWNTGWRHATASIVAYIDDDVRLHKDFVWQTLQAFDHPRVQAVTGLVFAEELDTAAQVIFEKYWSFNRGYQDLSYDTDYFKKHLRNGVPAWNAGSGANMAFRRIALRNAGGFDERLDVDASGYSGAAEMWYRLLAAGWIIRYSPRTITYHTHPKEMRLLRNKIYYYLKGKTSSLLAQYQRGRHRGILRYLSKTLPVYYAKLLLQRLRYPRDERYATLFQEIRGIVSGIRYFMDLRAIPPEYSTDSHEYDCIPEPLVSVIITTYNHDRFIADAIESALQQTVKPAEVIVVDDGSVDDTEKIVSRYPEVIYIRQVNKGLSAARNTGIFHSQGNYIVFLDADDLLYPYALAKNLRAFAQHPDCVFVSGWYDNVDATKKLVGTYENNIPRDNHYLALLRINYIGMHAAVMYRREVFNTFLFDETLPACEDYDLYLRIAKVYPIFSHNEKLAAYRMHANNMSKDANLMLRQAVTVLKKNANLKDQKIKKNYKAGIKNWTGYYTNKMYDRIVNRYLYPGYKHNAKDLFLVTTRIPFKMAKFYVRKMIGILNQPKKNFAVNMGDLRRTTPLSKAFGYDRGGPVDRYYIENFLAENADAIRGDVLEIGDNEYTLAYGGEKVTQSDILFIDDSNPQATIIGDLSTADHIPNERFDCIILTQTLHLIYDFDAAVRHCFRILKRDGVLLLTVPGITQIDYGEWHDTWYWSFTGRVIQRLLATYFNPQNVDVRSYGNVLAAVSFLYGMGKNEIEESKLNQTDPHYQVIITAKAVKQ